MQHEGGDRPGEKVRLEFFSKTAERVRGNPEARAEKQRGCGQRERGVLGRKKPKRFRIFRRGSGSAPGVRGPIFTDGIFPPGRTSLLGLGLAVQAAVGALFPVGQGEDLG